MTYEPSVHASIGIYVPECLDHIRSHVDQEQGIATVSIGNATIGVGKELVAEFCARMRDVLDRFETAFDGVDPRNGLPAMRQGLGA